MTQQIIPHDYQVEDYDFDFVQGDLLLDVDEESVGNDDTGETFITEVYSVEVVGLHIASNVCLTRDQLIQLQCKSYVEAIETAQLEKRREAIG